MKKFFNHFLISKNELNEIGRDGYRRGMDAGIKLASAGVLSATYRLKKLDTWDNDLKNEIIDILEIIYGSNR